jgi:hypothetical protein
MQYETASYRSSKAAFLACAIRVEEKHGSYFSTLLLCAVLIKGKFL